MRDLVDLVIGFEFSGTAVEATKAKAEKGQAEYCQDDDNVVRGHNFLPNHLEKVEKKQYRYKWVAIFEVLM